MDLLPPDDALAFQERVTADAPGSVFVSAESDGGLDPLRRALQTALRVNRPVVEIRFSHTNGKLLAEIHREGDVIEQRTVDEELVVRARVNDRLAGRLRQAGATVKRDGVRGA